MGTAPGGLICSTSQLGRGRTSIQLGACTLGYRQDRTAERSKKKCLICIPKLPLVTWFLCLFCAFFAALVCFMWFALFVPFNVLQRPCICFNSQGPRSAGSVGPERSWKGPTKRRGSPGKDREHGGRMVISVGCAQMDIQRNPALDILTNDTIMGRSQARVHTADCGPSACNRHGKETR